MHFRTDIAGLRAWAVSLVLLYHFSVPLFSGGFIGVDIFFVISGFLMGGILDRVLQDENRKRLWIVDFVLARAVRIWPALFAMVVLWMLWGWLQLGPEDYELIALEGIRAIIFRSNHFYAVKADYFADTTDLRLFLHSWSLSVEWVFYLCLAGLALACSLARRRSAAFLMATAGLSLASLVWMLVLTRTDPTSAFFSLSARAWEMGAGVLAYALGQRGRSLRPQRQRLLEWTGFALIALGLVWAAQMPFWPHPVTLVPVLGTGLILLAAREGSPLTAPRPFRFLGEISYSLYLWHWPISVALLQAGLLGQPLWQATGIVLSLIAGTLSWALIERPVRRHLARGGRGLKIAALLGMMLLAGAVLGAVRKYNGFPDRLPQEIRTEIQRIGARESFDKQCSTDGGRAEECQIGPQGDPGLLVIGDSHAGAMLDALAGSALARDKGISAWVHSGCRPVFGLRNAQGSTDCARFLDLAEAQLQRVPQTVPLLIIGRLPGLLEGENANTRRAEAPEDWLQQRHLAFDAAYRAEMAAALAQGICRIGAGREIFVLEPVPEMLQDPKRVLATSTIQGRAPVPPSISRDYANQRVVSSRAAIAEASRLCGAKLIPTQDLLCDAAACSSRKDGEFIYRDDDHLNIHGARLLIPRLEAVLGAR